MNSATSPMPPDADAEIASLVETLHQTDRRLEELLGGEVDTVMDKTGRTIVLRRAQSHLRQTENARQAAILNALPAQVALLDADGVIISVNAAWRAFAHDRAFGGREHGVGMTYLQVCAAARWGCSPEWEPAGAGIEEVLRGQSRGFALEYPCHAPGDERWFRLQVTALASPGFAERSQGAVVMHIDTTEQHEAALALAALSERTERRERQLNTMLSSVPDFAFTFDRNLRFTFVNQPLLDLWGITLEQALGKDFGDLSFPSPLVARLCRDVQQVFDSGKIVSGETPLLGAPGRGKSYEYIFSPAFAADASVDFVVGTTRDITARKHAEIALKKSFEELKAAQLDLSSANRELKIQGTELRLLFDLVPAMIMFKDMNNNFLRVNRRFGELVGRDVEDIEGKSAAEIYRNERAERFHEQDIEVMRSGKPLRGIVVQSHDAAGNTIWLQTDKVPVPDESGAITGIVVLCQDITERKRDQDALSELNADLEGRVRTRTAELNLAREDAERANGAKSEFLAIMSHEIRTPMSGLLGLLELLGLSGLDTEQAATLGVARQSGNALMRIIDDILDFSKIEANRLELNGVPASVSEVVLAAARLHSQIASAKSLDLHIDVAPQISARLLLDPLRLGQILNNFLNNAIKFTEHGSVSLGVELVSRAQGMEHLKFVVRDTGIGMTGKQISGLFQPFVQGEASTSARFGGTGLGLVIAQRLAHLMQGTVEVASEPGRGTEFTFCAPFRICEAESDTGASQADGMGALKELMNSRRPAPGVAQAEAEGTLLLVVDDHPINRRVLLGQAASLGYAAEPACDGVEALQAWRTGRFGGIVTDCNMPRMNGYDFAAAVRREEAQSGRGLRIPIIGCTANALASAAQQCIAAGMDDWVVKPANLLEMAGKLDQWLPLHARYASEVTRAPAASQAVARQATVSGLIDMVLLAEISAGDVDMQADMLAEFSRVNRVDAAALRNAVSAGDFALVTLIAHRFKGGSLMLGSTLLAQACAQVEAAASGRERPLLLDAVEVFETELLRLNLYLDSLLAARAVPS